MSATLPLSFRVGDKVVYPNHGVGVVEHISNRPVVDGSFQKYYLLKIQSSNLRVMVPFTNIAQVGMRAVTEVCELTTILSYLGAGGLEPCPVDWKLRFKENSEKMRDGSLAHVAEVLKSLLQLHQVKPLSFREKKMLHRAQALLLDEVASAKGLDENEAALLLQQTLAKAHLTLPAPSAEA